MRIMTLGRWASLPLLLSAIGCGGSGSFAKPVPFRATLLPGSTQSQVSMIITRNNRTPTDNNDVCTFDRSVPDWCRQNYPELNFDVQPSNTLYRVYIHNLGSTVATARVRMIRDGEDKGTSQLVEIQPGQDFWAWELGVETTKDRTR